jgi:hypothetical protein
MNDQMVSSMKNQKSPQLKKQDSYEKDHRTQMENPHAFRKNWPKKKAKENRRDRMVLRSSLAWADLNELTGKAVAKLRRKTPIVKSFVSTLRASVKAKKRKRLHKLLAKARGPSLHGTLMQDSPD